jgi:hypothetical protein
MRERENPRSGRVKANQGLLGAPVSSDLTGKREYIGNKTDLQTIVFSWINNKNNVALMGEMSLYSNYKVVKYLDEDIDEMAFF